MEDKPNPSPQQQPITEQTAIAPAQEIPNTTAKNPSPSKTQQIPTKQSPTKSMSSTFYSPGKNRLDDQKALKFKQTNPFQGSQYHNMTAVCGVNKKATNEEVLNASLKAVSRIGDMLKTQKSQEFLVSSNLPQVPECHSPPKMIMTKDKKTISYYKAQNDAHGRTTNGGFKRTEYGGFFMH